MTFKKYIYELLNLVAFIAFAILGILLIALISIGICYLIYHKIIGVALSIIWNIVFILFSPFIMPASECTRKYIERKLAFLNK